MTKARTPHARFDTFGRGRFKAVGLFGGLFHHMLKKPRNNHFKPWFFERFLRRMKNSGFSPGLCEKIPLCRIRKGQTNKFSSKKTPTFPALQQG